MKSQGISGLGKSELTEGGRHRLQRKTQKHFEFQHEGHVDFHFTKNIEIDKKSKKSLDKGVHFIKNATESGGDEEHIEEEMKHLAEMGGDGHISRSFKDKHSLIQKEEAIISDVKY